MSVVSSIFGKCAVAYVLSLCTMKSHTSTYIMGTIGYIDPEYARTFRLTEKSDVHSCGIVLLELLTSRKALDNESNLNAKLKQDLAK